MKVIIIALIVIALGTLAFFGLKGNKEETTIPKTKNNVTANTVSIENMSFKGSSLAVKAGTEVTWKNNDSITHTVTSDTGAFESGNLAPGNTYKHVFDKTGTYPYICSLHPTMRATIIVQ